MSILKLFLISAAFFSTVESLSLSSLNPLLNQFDPIGYVYIYTDYYDNQLASDIGLLQATNSSLRTFTFESASNSSAAADWAPNYCKLVRLSNTSRVVFLFDDVSTFLTTTTATANGQQCSNLNQLVIVFENHATTMTTPLISNTVVNSLVFLIQLTNNSQANLNITLYNTNLTFNGFYSMNSVNVNSLLTKLNTSSIQCYCNALRVGILNASNLNLLFSNDDTSVMVPDARIYDLMAQTVFRTIAKTLGLNYVLILAPDNRIGEQLPNGSWTGLIGMLTRNEIDIAVSAIPISYNIYQVVDFTSYYKKVANGILIYKAIDFKSSFLNVFMPLDYTLWICSMVAILFVAVVLRCIYLFDVAYAKRMHFEHANHHNILHEIEFSFRRCITYAFGKYFNQNIDYETHHKPSRMVVIIYSFFTIIMPATYTASLISYLTNPPYLAPINTLSDLAYSSAFKPLIQSGSSAEFYLREHEQSTVNSLLLSRLSSDPIVQTNPNNQTIVDLLMNENYALLGEVEVLNYYTQIFCDLNLLSGITYGTYELGFALSKQFTSLTSLFSKQIVHLQEGGILEQIFYSLFNTDQTSSCDDSSAAQPITIEKFVGTLVVLAGTVLVGFLILLLEIVANKRGWKLFNLPISYLFFNKIFPQNPYHDHHRNHDHHNEK